MRTSIDEFAGQRELSDDHDHKPKNFNIVPPKDPDQLKTVRAREDACTDPELTDGARNLFTYLLDQACNPYVHQGRKGQVAISTTQLSQRLSRSKRAIYGWVRELVEQRHVWLTKLPRPNMKPMHVYHVTALQPKRESHPDLPGDGMWGNGYRRPDQVMPLGARGASCKKRHYLVDRFGQPLFAYLPDNATATRTKDASHPQILRVGAAQNDTCHPQNLRVDSAQNDTCHPQNLRVPPAQNDTMQRQKPALLRETQRELETPKEIETIKGGRGRPPQVSVEEAIKGPGWEVWRKNLSRQFPRELKETKAELQRKLTSIQKNPKNLDLSGAPLKPEAKEFLDYIGKRMKSLEADQTEQARRELATRQREATRFLSDPANYESLVLTPVARDQVELLKRKIAVVSEYLEGPSA